MMKLRQKINRRSALSVLHYKNLLALVFVAIAMTFSMSRVHALPLRYVAATTPSSCQTQSFFGLLPWYQYLQLDPATCEIKEFHILPGGGQHSDVLLVVLALIDDLLRVAGLIAVGYLIYASISFITSQGNSEDAAHARGAAINALVGLVIALLAIVFVQFIGNRLGG